MKCPKCGENSNLRLTCLTTVDLDTDGIPVSGTEWECLDVDNDEQNEVHCDDCGHTGTYSEFENPKPKPRKGKRK